VENEAGCHTARKSGTGSLEMQRLISQHPKTVISLPSRQFPRLSEKVEVRFAEPSDPGVAEFLGNGDGTFQQAKVYHSGVGYTAAVGDLNGDHKPDVVLLGSKPLAITSMLNTGVLEFSPCSPLAFGAQPVKATSKPKIVSLTNTGSKPISFNSMRVTGAFRARDTCGGTIAAGAVCRVDVTFTPSKPGHERGGITIVDSASSKPQYIELSGVGK
jgi:hypothetical protein